MVSKSIPVLESHNSIYVNVMITTGLRDNSKAVPPSTLSSFPFVPFRLSPFHEPSHVSMHIFFSVSTMLAHRLAKIAVYKNGFYHQAIQSDRANI